LCLKGVENSSPPSPRPIKVIEKKIGKKLNKSELVEFWRLLGS